MARFTSSDLALEVLVALDQRPEGLGLTELARCLERGTSAVQRALEVLSGDGLLQHQGGRTPFLPRVTEPAVAAARVIAHRLLPPGTAIRIALRASQVPAFAGEDTEGFVYVARPLADDDEEVRLAGALRTISAGRPETPAVERIAEPEVRSSPTVAGRLSQMRALAGSVQVLLPKSRTERGRFLRKLHPSLGRVPRAAILEAAQRHRLRRVVVFGSAVRSDFARGSDVDLLVEPAAGDTLDLARRLDIASTFERIFGRPVDIVSATRARASVLEEARREGVVLVG